MGKLYKPKPLLKMVRMVTQAKGKVVLEEEDKVEAADSKTTKIMVVITTILGLEATKTMIKRGLILIDITLQGVVDVDMTKDDMTNLTLNVSHVINLVIILANANKYLSNSSLYSTRRGREPYPFYGYFN